MLLDVRTYTCRPGTIKKHLALYAKLGARPQSKSLGKPLLYMTTETGNPNQYVHIWAYERVRVTGKPSGRTYGRIPIGLVIPRRVRNLAPSNRKRIA
jgi:hypothetical protein